MSRISLYLASALAIVVQLAYAPTPAVACLHASGAGSEPIPVSQKGQQALILHRDGVEDLILKVEYQTGDTESLAWIVPVPRAPTAYATADAALFDSLASWVALSRQPPALRRKSKSKAAPAGQQATLTLLPPAAVGPFAIQPIQASGPAAGSALNAWMTEHGFQELPAETLSYYLQRDWTFLAIRVTPDKEGAGMAKEGGLPPLRVTFPSDQAVYPLKLSTHMGTFAARVYLITADVLPESAFAGARARGFEVVSNGQYFYTAGPTGGRLRAQVGRFPVTSAPDAVRGLLAERFGAAQQLSLSVLLNEKVNATDIGDMAGTEVRYAPADWSEELAVPALPEKTAGAATGTTTGEPTGATPPTGERPASEKKSKSKSSGCAAGGLPTSVWLCLPVLLLACRRRRCAATVQRG